MSIKKHLPIVEQFPSVHLVEYGTPQDLIVDPTHTILQSSQWPEGRILEIASEGTFQHFLNSQNRNYPSELHSALKILAQPEEFISNPFSALFETKPKSLHLRFSEPNDKAPMISKIDVFVKALGSTMITDHLRVLFEELFMNAVFDAPEEAKKMGLIDPKTQKVSEMIIAFDNDKINISCRDPYGSLNTHKLIKRMSDIEKSGTADIINLGQRPGGAGIGCSLLHRYSSSIVVAVIPGQVTMVTCSIPLRTSLKNFLLTGKNLQIINLPITGGNNGK